MKKCRHEVAVTCFTCGQKGNKNNHHHHPRPYELCRHCAATLNTEPDVVCIPSIVSHGRSKHQCCASRSDARNLFTLVDNTRWTLPVILGVNARSLSIEKADELLSVSSRNDVSCVCVTVTWFRSSCLTNRLACRVIVVRGRTG